jgi:DNA-binding CsgD family transcriptional regulator
MGEDTKARELIEDQLSRLGSRRSRARGVALRRLAAVVALPARPALLREAVEILAACDDRLELGYARADLAAALEASNGRRRPASPGRLPAGDAGAASRENEAEPADGRGAAAGAVEDGRLAGLTDAERRVAALAAAGATNRQIAGKLFITVSTVEQHLTKIYRKLKVRRRSALPVGMLRDLE